MGELTIDECKRIISKGWRQLTEAQERIAELERERGEWQLKFCKEAWLHVSDVFMRDELIRDMYLQLLNAYDVKELDEFAERMRAIGIEVQP